MRDRDSFTIAPRTLDVTSIDFSPLRKLVRALAISPRTIASTIGRGKVTSPKSRSTRSTEGISRMRFFDFGFTRTDDNRSRDHANEPSAFDNSADDARSHFMRTEDL